MSGVRADEPYLDVRDLRVDLPVDDGTVRAVDGVSFALAPGRTLAVVGESGAGKSVTAQALLGLHAGTGARVDGQVLVGGTDVVSAPATTVRAMRGRDVSIVFQDSSSALNPYLTVGSQVAEAYRVHHPQASRGEVRDRVVAMLDRVGVPAARTRVDDYPHQLSGGMRQRVMIAMALICGPRLLVADEPTTALDVTVQAQVLTLLSELQAELGTAIVLVTHDLGVVAEVADEVLVMYAGRVVEHAAVDDLFHRPEMPYTWGLLGSLPRLDRERRPRLAPVPGSPPSALDVPSGCAFHPRCAWREHVPEGPGRCEVDAPRLLAAAPGHDVRCHVPHARRVALREAAVGRGLPVDEGGAS